MAKILVVDDIASNLCALVDRRAGYDAGQSSRLGLPAETFGAEAFTESDEPLLVTLAAQGAVPDYGDHPGS